MSMMICTQCDRLVDTDQDSDSLYVPGFDCVCEFCRARLDLEVEWGLDPEPEEDPTPEDDDFSTKPDPEIPNQLKDLP